MDYLRRIYEARYFWWHLAQSDLRHRYRRSSLGIAWAVMQPLGMTLLIAYVMGSLLGHNLGDYALYIFSGLVIWEYIGNATIGGCSSFLSAAVYTRQFTHPYAIYTLRHILGGFINFLIAFSGVLLWTAFKSPENMGLSWFSLLPACLILLVFAWGIATICAFLSTWFHDFSQMVVLMLQAMYFVSPIFIQPSMFRNNGLGYLVDYNPFYHLFELFRAPLLQGDWPTLLNFAFSAGSVMGVWLIAALFIRHKERNLIFYI